MLIAISSKQEGLVDVDGFSDGSQTYKYIGWSVLRENFFSSFLST